MATTNRTNVRELAPLHRFRLYKWVETKSEQITAEKWSFKKIMIEVEEAFKEAVTPITEGQVRRALRDLGVAYRKNVRNTGKRQSTVLNLKRRVEKLEEQVEQLLEVVSHPKASVSMFDAIAATK